MTDDSELRRLQHVYARYDADAGEQAKRDPGNAGLAHIEAERVRALHDLLRVEGLLPLTGKRVLDVGSGRGDELARVISAGADPTGSAGVDLLPGRVEQARLLHPELRFVCADARALPFESDAFELVLANVVFSSILDDSVATAMADELQRVLTPDGAIVWWDNRYPTPGNPNVRGYDRRKLERLFPSCRLQACTTTLLPPVARRLGRAAPVVYPLLAQVPFLRGRYLAVIRPGGRPGIQGKSRNQAT